MGRSNVSLARKKQLEKPDKFMDYSRNLLRLVLENRLKLYVALGVFFAGALIFAGSRYYLDRSGEKAFTLLSEGMNKYRTLVDESGPAKALQAVEKDFQSILDKYSQRIGGKLARLVLANMYYGDHQYKKAIPLYEKGLKDFRNQPAFKNIILNSLAYSYEAVDDEKSSAKYFERIISESEPLMKGDALFNLGRLYEKWGQKDKSNDAFRQIIDSYKDSIYTDVVKEKLAM